MSVINKMLRDLDQRQAPAAPANTLLRGDTASVPPPPRMRRRSPALRWATALLPLAAVLAGGFVWWSFQSPPVPAPVPIAAALPSPLPQPIPVPPVVPAAEIPAPSVAVAASAAPASVVAPVHAGSASTPLSVGLRMDATLSPPPVALPAQPTAAASAALAAKVPATSAAPVVSASPVAPLAPPPAKALPSTADGASLAARQQQAGREALAQAQTLWASGARDSALSTLHEAVAAAERNPQSMAASVLAPMARELARMELAEGRPAAAWDLLVRLEPLLADQPELWALRANAAQRLGRHQDSVQAYSTALQSRPGEQRWLLGAAVSLAALGQTTAAAEMADKARVVGPVSREVLAYLRQQGVPLTDRP